MYSIGQGFVPPKFTARGNTLMVGEAPGEEETKANEPFVGGAGRWLQNMSRIAGHKWPDVSLANTICCRPPSNIYPTDNAGRSYISAAEAQAAVAHCAQAHLYPAVRKAVAAGKTKLYAIGGQALTQLTGKTGITTWRGSILPLRKEVGVKGQVVPTIHPAALMRQAKLTSVAIRDLRRPFVVPPENYNLFPNVEDVARFKARRFAFDFEWNAAGEITLCGLSDRLYGALVVPFQGPYIDLLRVIFERAEALIGHNIVGADLKWIEELGWNISRASIEDTMLKQHLCQPDFNHGLDFVASVFTNKVFWKGKGWEEMDEVSEGESISGQQWRTWDRADALPRKMGGYGGCLSGREAFALYNARDTDAEFQVNTALDPMLTQFDLEPVYRNVSLPAAYICRWMAERGIKLDTSRLGEIRTGIDEKIAELETRLPVGLAPYEEQVSCNLPAPEGTYKRKEKVCKGSRKLPHEPWTAVFTEPGEVACPSCGKSLAAGKMELAKIVKGTRLERVTPYSSAPQVQTYVDNLGLKAVIDRKTGSKTTGKRARGIWAKDHPEFVILGALKEQVTRRNNFAKDTLLDQERMYFNLKVHGTSEGRLSSTGRRRGIDLNIQNQPEDFRVIYVPDHPGWGFVNLDISQGENWLTTWIARDWERWERLQNPAYDEHGDLASRIFNKKIDKASIKLDPELNALRQIGKKINHGRNYGMGVNKQREELVSQGYDHFTTADVKEFIAIWKQMNARTAVWQDETIEIANRQGYLRNPFGRIRWFSSRSVATEALAFLPASTLADMVLRMMICHYPLQFGREIEANGTSVYFPIVEDWIMSIQVHDSIVLQGPWESHREQYERSSQIMTQNWPQLYSEERSESFHFKVDAKGSQRSWGDVKGLPPIDVESPRKAA